MSNKTAYGNSISIAINTKYIMDRIHTNYSNIVRSMVNYQLNETSGNLGGVEFEKSVISYYADRLAADKRMMDDYLTRDRDIPYRDRKNYYQLSATVDDLLNNPVVVM